MILKSYFRNVLVQSLGLDQIRSDLMVEKKRNDDLEEKIQALELKLVETSRAIATLAIAHAGLVREFGRFLDIEDKKRAKAVVTRKIKDDFTN